MFHRSFRSVSNRFTGCFMKVLKVFVKSSQRCSQSPFRLTTGTDVSGLLFSVIFSFLLFLFPFFSPLSKLLIEGVLESKILFCEKLTGTYKNQGYTNFQTPSAIMRPPDGHFGFCRWYCVGVGAVLPCFHYAVINFLIEGVLESKNLTSENRQEGQKPKGRPLLKSNQTFRAHLEVNGTSVRCSSGLRSGGQQLAMM